MSDVVVFHHAQGLTGGVVAFADRLRAAGHTVHTPDVYDGHTFADLDSGIAYAKGVGFGHLMEAGVASAEGLGSDLVYVGISLGVMPAQFLAQTRAGTRAAVLVGSAVPPDAFEDEGAPATWPVAVPVQIHGMDADPVFVGEGDIDAARELVEKAGAELHLYPGDGHLFVDSSLPDSDPAATDLVIERILALLDRLD